MEGPTAPVEGEPQGQEMRGDQALKIVRTRIIYSDRLVSIMVGFAAWARALGVSP